MNDALKAELDKPLNGIDRLRLWVSDPETFDAIHTDDAEAIIAEIERLNTDAARYNWLRSRDLDTISQGGVFAGMTPENVVLNEEDLDRAIDAAMSGE